MHSQPLKRLLDVILAGLGLILLSPVLTLLALLVRRKLGWPVLFTQERLGLNGRVFRVIKFRSMTDARDADGNLLPDADRLTPFGRFLRRSSLDELPELVNVLRGKMSFVGPRPLKAIYKDRYNARQMRRHEVRPGITGWAQINGRNATTWEERFELDVWYVEHWSLWLDLKIMLRTVLAAFSGQGVSQEGHATMPDFMGTPDD
jgi:sugar transferase EpsL